MTKPGLPKLHDLAKSGHFAKKLHLKGKGHEFTDAARLLTYYQLWLDDLYPRAKFADALQLVEKAGHSKTMQRQRKDWIDEGKPSYIRDRERRKEMDAAEAAEEGEYTMSGGLNPADAGANEAHGENGQSPPASGAKDATDEGDLFIPDAEDPVRNDNEPDEDELDALLADRDDNTSRPQPAAQYSDSEDDLDALLAAHDARRVPTTTSKPAMSNGMFEDDNEDDLDALLAERETTKEADSLSKSGPPEQTETSFTIATPSVPARSIPEESVEETNSGEVRAEDELQDDDDVVHLDGTKSAAQSDLQSDPIGPKSKRETAQTGTQASLPDANETELELSESPLARSQTPMKNDSQGKQSVAIFSSSPIPNDMMEMDDLDALLEEQGRS